MTTEEVEKKDERGVEEGEEVSISDKRWKDLRIQVGDLLEVKCTSEDPAKETAFVAFLVTGVREGGLVEGRYLGSNHEEVAKHCATAINRRGLPLHVCEEFPCTHRGEEVGGHVVSLRWWTPASFKGDYVKAWGKTVLKEWIEKGTIKKRIPGVKPGNGGKKPLDRRNVPLRGRRKVVPPKAPWDPDAAKGDQKKKREPSQDRGGLGDLKDRLAGLRQKLRGARGSADPEVIDVEEWSRSHGHGEELDYAEHQLALGLGTGDHLDPGLSRLALAPAVKPEDTKDGILRGRKRKTRRVRMRKEKRSRGPAGQLLEVAEMQQQKRSEEKRKKDRKSKSSGSKGVKELVRLLENKKKKRKKEEDSPEPSDSGMSGSETSGEDSSSSDSQMLAPLQKKSLKKPGTVLKMLTRHARQTLDQTAVLEVDESQEITGGVKMATYFNLLIRPYHPATSRDMKELHYLSICMDELRSGRLGALGDSLASRFLAVHSAVNEGGWRTAQHLELHPLEGAQSAPTPLLLQARRHSKLVAKSQGRDENEKRWRGGYDRGWRQEEWQETRGKGKGSKGKGKGRGKSGYGKGDGWNNWQGGGGDKSNWWDKNKEKNAKDDGKEKKGDK